MTHRQLLAKILHVVEPARSTNGSRIPSAEHTDSRCELTDASGREHPRQEGAVKSSGRRVLKDHRARKDLEATLEHVEGSSTTGYEGLSVDMGTLDIFPPAQCVENPSSSL